METIEGGSRTRSRIHQSIYVKDAIEILETELFKDIIAARAAKWNMQQCHCRMQSRAQNRSMCRL